MSNSGKNPRATKEQLKEREDHVLEMLQVDKLSAPEIAEKLNISYPQTILVLNNLESSGKIERIPGRWSRKIRFQLCGPYSKVEAQVLKPIVDCNSVEIRTLAVGGRLYMDFGDICDFAECTPNMHAELVNLVGEHVPEEFLNQE